MKMIQPGCYIDIRDDGIVGVIVEAEILAYMKQCFPHLDWEPIDVKTAFMAALRQCGVETTEIKWVQEPER